MASSGTYTLDPTVASFTDEAFERCGVDPAGLTVRHLRSARLSCNLLLAYWATRGVNQWAIDTQNFTVTDADPEYNAASGTLAILTMVVRRSSVDTPVYPMSRDEYRGVPSKTDEGMPVKFLFDREITTQTITLWPTPENSTDVVYYDRLRRIQDVSTAAETTDLPYPWFEAFASGLAEFLSLKFAVDRHDKLKAVAADRFHFAHEFERERFDLQMTVSLRR